MSREVRTRPRRQCSHHSCGHIARYRSTDTDGVYCPDHAAELCPYVVLRPIEGYDRRTIAPTEAA